MATRTYASGACERRRLARFLVVGAGGTLLDFTLLLLLKQTGLVTAVANSMAFGAGIVNNYLWNRYWTYADARDKPIGTQLTQFILVSLGGMLLNTGAVLLCEAALDALLGGAGWTYIPAKIVATAVSVGWNYVANRRWTFSDAR